MPPSPPQGQTFDIKETEQRLDFPRSSPPSSGQERTSAPLGMGGEQKGEVSLQRLGGGGGSRDASFKPYHYLGRPVSCVLAGESRVKYSLNTDTSEPASQWDGKAEGQPVSSLFS